MITVITNLTGGWTYSTFGFISTALIPIPWILYQFGARLRAASKYNPQMSQSMMTSVLGHDEEMQMQKAQMQGMDTDM